MSITEIDCIHVSEAAKLLGLDARYLQRTSVRERLGLRVARHPRLQDDRLRFFDRLTVDLAAQKMRETREVQHQLRAGKFQSQKRKKPLSGSFPDETTI